MVDRQFLYRKMHALLRELGIESSKQYILESYGVEHTNELSDADLQALVNRLVSMESEHGGWANRETRHWRSTLLSLLNKYGVYVTNEDWTDVNRVLLNKKIAGKLLYEMSIKEIQATCIRLRTILSKRQEVMEKNDRLAKLN